MLASSRENQPKVFFTVFHNSTIFDETNPSCFVLFVYSTIFDELSKFIENIVYQFMPLNSPSTISKKLILKLNLNVLVAFSLTTIQSYSLNVASSSTHIEE